MILSTTPLLAAGLLTALGGIGCYNFLALKGGYRGAEKILFLLLFDVKLFIRKRA